MKRRRTIASDVFETLPDGTYRHQSPGYVAPTWFATRAEAEAYMATLTPPHDCWAKDAPAPVHRTFRTARGTMQDAYYCATCGKLMQVG